MRLQNPITSRDNARRCHDNYSYPGSVLSALPQEGPEDPPPEETRLTHRLNRPTAPPKKGYEQDTSRTR